MHYRSFLGLGAAGVLGLLGVGVLSPAALGVVVTFPASQDNTLFQNSTGALSNGAGPNMFAGLTAQDPGINMRRGLVAFDVSSIPSGSTVTGVTLTLYMAQTRSGSANIALHRLTASWGEGTSNSGVAGGAGDISTPGDATWLHRFFDQTLWANVGGDFDPFVSAATPVGGVGTYTWSGARMMADVQAWVNGGGNFGWLIQGDESRSSSVKRFATREAATPSQRPALQVTYVPVPAPPSMGVLLGAIALATRRRR